MTTLEFQPWPKIARLNREMVITEKIDGTNAAVIVSFDVEHGLGAGEITSDGYGIVVNLDKGTGWDPVTVAAQSRKRLISPEADNFGFARWVREHAEELARLGPGHHFGEWWGSGIQRGYGLVDGEKRFSLFNTNRWTEDNTPDCVGVVPVLYSGPFDSGTVQDIIDSLDVCGSAAAPGFAKPEGVVIFHVASQNVYKVTVEKDEAPKGQA